MIFVLKLAGATPGAIKNVQEHRPHWKIIPSMGAFSAYLEVYDDVSQRNFWAETTNPVFIGVLEDDLDAQRHKAVGKWMFPELHVPPVRPTSSKPKATRKSKNPPKMDVLHRDL